MSLAKAGFTLGIRPVATLRPHEETIQTNVEKLGAEMMRDGIQKDPIMIDGESSTVLDGMHRLAAFLAMKVENAVCCSVDYSSRAVTLGRWARVYTLSKGDSFAEFLSPAGLTRRTTLADAFQALEAREAGMAALTSAAAYLPEDDIDLDAAMGAMNSFDGLAAAKGVRRQFVAEEDVDGPLQSERNLVVLVRRLVKEDVVTAARTRRLFPCKTSMHSIDPRPVAVNFPIGELDRATAKSLKEFLSRGSERLLPRDSVYEGRRYKERLLLLNPG